MKPEAKAIAADLMHRLKTGKLVKIGIEEIRAELWKRDSDLDEEDVCRAVVEATL
jgi:hypothetical protein